MSVEISVIIVSYNCVSALRRCLTSLDSSDLPWTEVIVVDNASMDDTVQVVATEFPQTHLIVNKINLGFGVAVNQAARLATGNHLFFLNPDTIVPRDVPIQLSSFRARIGDVDIVGCTLVDCNGRPQPSCWRNPSLLTVSAEMFLPYKLSLYLITEQRKITGRVQLVSGAAMVIRRRLFEELNGFDEQFFMFYEDFDICYRARNAGASIYFLSDVNIVHQIGGSSGDRESFFCQIYESKLKYLRKHFKPAAFALARLLIIVGVSLRIPIYALVGSIFANSSFNRLSGYHKAALGHILGDK